MKKIVIHNDFDIIIARLRAREVARELGFGTIDQARISLAAGELARILASCWEHYGEIVISGIDTDDHLGIQVIAKRPDNTTRETVEIEAEQEQVISRLTSLVDEHVIKNQGDKMTSVTLMKWLS